MRCWHGWHAGVNSTASLDNKPAYSIECTTSCIWRTLQQKTHVPSAATTTVPLPPIDAMLHPDFVRKYVYFARHQVVATLSEEACQSIANAYADLRTKADERTLPVHQ